VTLQEELEELARAWAELRDALLEACGIPRLAAWLNRKLS
jgi:hypothetical protein